MSGSRRHAPIATAILLGIALAVALAVGAAGCSGSTDETVTSTTVGAPTTSVVAVSTTTTSAAIPGTTTTTGLVVSTTGSGEPTTGTTATASPDGWQKASTSLGDLAGAIAQRLPEGQSVDLPDHLPAGWALARPGQPFGDTAAGYFADQTENPAVTTMDGPDGPFGEYRVVFTDGTEIAGILVVIGDWGETDFKETIFNGVTLHVYEDESIVVALVPGWEFGTVVGTPGAREAVLEMAASIKSW
jgi:hypothetical protein